MKGWYCQGMVAADANTRRCHLVVVAGGGHVEAEAGVSAQPPPALHLYLLDLQPGRGHRPLQQLDRDVPEEEIVGDMSHSYKQCY